jgi:putative membrane protein
MQPNPEINLSRRIIMKKQSLFLFVCFVVASVMVVAQTAQAVDGGDHSDSEFLKKALESGRLEVELSDLALQRSTNKDVKELATMLKDDHEKAIADLKKISVDAKAGSGSGHEADDMGKDHSRIEEFSDLKEGEFDKEYVKTTIRNHEESIETSEHAMKETENPEIRRFAESLLPVLKQHLEHAQRLQERLEGMSQKSGSH